MDCYFIEISGIPKECVHPGFRSFESFYEPDTYTLFLSVNGRLTNRHCKRANLKSQELAEALLEYWEPRLSTRGWGSFSSNVRRERADRWREKLIPKSSSEAMDFLNSHANSPIRTQSKDIGSFVIVVEGIRTNSFSYELGYWSRDKKHGWVISSSLAHAQRYKSHSYCTKVINERLARSNSKNKARVHKLTAEELIQIKDDKEEHWNHVFCRF
jgi:hypothetical protein